MGVLLSRASEIGRSSSPEQPLIEATHLNASNMPVAMARAPNLLEKLAGLNFHAPNQLAPQILNLS